MMRPHQSYQKVNVSTADPVRIIVLLYEGAIKNLNQAIRAIDGDRELMSAKITRTLDIINYLRNALDHEKGGEIAGNLERLYEYMRDVLSQANIHPDAAKMEHVISLLQTVLEGWRGIVANQTADGEAAADPAAAEAPQAPPPPRPANLSMVG